MEDWDLYGRTPRGRCSCLFVVQSSTAESLEVKDLLIETSDYVPKLASRSVSRGRINLGSAVASLIPDWLPEAPKIVRSRRGDFGIFHISTQGLPAGDYQSDVLLRFSEKSIKPLAFQLRLHVGHLYRAHQRRLPSSPAFLKTPAGISVDNEYFSTSIDLGWPNFRR